MELATGLLLCAMLALALLLQPLAARLGLPFPAMLLLAGFAGSELLLALGQDTGLRAEGFHDLIFYVFLPVLVFAAAFSIDASALARNLLPILVLALPVMLLSTLITAALVYYGIGHPRGFPWIAALLTGALLSATDPAAVTALFRALGVPERLVVLFEGESLFNDALAIVLFGLLLGLALDPSRSPDLGLASREFGRVFAGGMLTGLAGGLLFLVLARWRCSDAPALQGLVTLIAAYSSYLVAESLLGVSGVMAVLVCGLILGRLAGDYAEPAGRQFLQHLWQLNAYVASALVFLLMGATVTLAMFGERWLAMLIGIAGVLGARALGIFGIVPLLSLLPGVERITLGQQACLAWGGLRGAVALALALSLPVELEYWWTIQSIAFGVVLFSLLVQAPTVPPLIRRLGLAKRG